MPPAPIRLPSLVPALIASAALAWLTPPGAALAQNPPNVRPFVDIGYSQPLEFFDLDQGYGFGFGFEMEQSRRVSMLLRIEWNLLTGPDYYYTMPGYFPVYQDPRQVTTTSWSLGPRIHLVRRATFRPYVEACLGVRVGSDGRSYYNQADADDAGNRRNVEGLVAQAGLGVTTARYRGGGMNLSVGIELPFRDPERFYVVPVRLGIVFP